MAALFYIAHDLDTVLVRYTGHHIAADVDKVYDELERNTECSHCVRFYVDLSGVTSHALNREDLISLNARVTECAASRTITEPHPLLLAYYAPTLPAQQVGRACTGRWNLHPDLVCMTSALRKDCATFLHVDLASLQAAERSVFYSL
ncbi:hypothetical protein [Thalassobius sp. Cn5-15]|uniref:hypothetical protein n=1 Tax=Thalassobius sp. Cn5-15 TaxID=2917763 RepID=UPI001EF3078B|nr:hypothetical protein [Thalassobius sp. Cn5-15]MCG7492207.1 hypothetical protein [Thalassobius sp. Cn5-15]